MKLYSKYIVINLIMPVLVITMTLTGIIWLTQSLKFIDLIVNRGLDVSTFLYLSSLLIPSLLLILLPIALFISVLYVYNRMISDREIIVYKSAGLSRLQLAYPAFVVAGFITLFAYLVSLYLMPLSYKEFKDMQAFIRNNYASVLLQEGVFSTPTKTLTVYIESRGKDGLLKGILVHDSRDAEKPVTMMAQEGRLIQTETGPKFYLINGNRQEIDKKEGNLSLLYFESYPFDLSVYSSEVERSSRVPEEMHLNELFFPEERFRGKDRNKLIAEGHNRLTWPLLTILLTLLGLSALFSGQFNRRGQWKRILSATITGCFVIIGQIILKSIIVINPILAVLLYAYIIGLFILFSYIIVTSRTINSFAFVYDLVVGFFKKIYLLFKQSVLSS